MPDLQGGRHGRDVHFLARDEEARASGRLCKELGREGERAGEADCKSLADMGWHARSVGRRRSGPAEG